MNFLALCQRLGQEAGISGTGPTTVVSQTGEMLRIVEWINAAYEDVQNTHATWKFLRTDFSDVTVATTQEYTPADFSITDFGSWIEEDIRVYTAEADEQRLDYDLWLDFKLAFMYASNRSQTEKPTNISIRPSDNALVLWPIPNAVYTVVGEYYKTGDVLSGDADIPLIPTRFQLIIVWKALMLYGAYTAADEKYAHGQNEYKKVLRALELDQLEQLHYGEPLA